MVHNCGFEGKKPKAVTFLQVLSVTKPFHKVPNHIIALQVTQGKRPRPLPSIPNRVWEVLRECWSGEPTRRPTLKDITSMCRMYASQDVQVSLPSPARSSSNGSERDSLSWSWDEEPRCNVSAFPLYVPAIQHIPEHTMGPPPGSFDHMPQLLVALTAGRPNDPDGFGFRSGQM